MKSSLKASQKAKLYLVCFVTVYPQALFLSATIDYKTIHCVRYMTTSIGIARTTRDPSSVRSAINTILTEINAPTLIAGKKRILLKPNLFVAKSPDAGLTTHPEVVGAMIDWLIDHGIAKKSIVVGESSSTLSSNATKRAFKVCGIQDVCEAKGIRWTPFEGTKMVQVNLPDGKSLKQVNVSEELAAADLVINIPIFKTHNLTVITLAIKNMFGSLVLTNKTTMHANFPNPADFAEMLVDIYSASKPALTIVDGITAIEGNGPGAGGKVVDLGILLAGTDPVAMDTICTEIMGFDHNTVLSTQAAARRGLGTSNLAEIEIKGIPLKEIQRNFEFPSSYKMARFLFSRFGRLISPLMKKFSQVRATYDKRKCVACGDCVKICPVQALAIDKKEIGKPPVWTKAKCIACHCCEEICPKGAAHVGIAGIYGIWPYILILLAGLIGIIWLIGWLASLL